jgi:hypothetical protein
MAKHFLTTFVYSSVLEVKDRLPINLHVTTRAWGRGQLYPMDFNLGVMVFTCDITP